MSRDNLIQRKSYAFAVRIVRLYQHLCVSKREYVLSKQLLRCGTSIGANIEEGVGAQSRADFVSKLSVAYKEARETLFWIRILNDTGYFAPVQFVSIRSDADELCRILVSILKSTKGGAAAPRAEVTINNQTL